MILIGLGANLHHPRFGPPLASCRAALGALRSRGVVIEKCSRWYESAPLPASDQPWFVNAVAAVASPHCPAQLLALLHEVEADFGRVRGARNAARVLDLDLLAYHDLVRGPGAVPLLPHPRLAERAFVVVPLAELAPDWRHPASGRSARELARAFAGSPGIAVLD